MGTIVWTTNGHGSGDPILTRMDMGDAMTRLNMTGDKLREYDGYLARLISLKSVFTDDHGIRNALDYCMSVMSASRETKTYLDSSGNLISIPNNFDPTRPAVYLSAHIDTVDANPRDWVTVKDPFVAADTETHIIGRGANDCKAGVAFILLLAHLSRNPSTLLDNVVSLISYREEGNGAKTSTRIGEALGKTIPLSEQRNLILCLENTVKVDSTYSIGIYDSEPCNIFIEIRSDLPGIRKFLTSHDAWKPVYVCPVAGAPDTAPTQSHSGKGGHAATVPNHENLIYKAIMEAGDHAIVGGDYVQTSVIDNRVEVFPAASNTPHIVVCNFRGLSEVADIIADLGQLDYRARFPLAYAAGSDRRALLANSYVKKLIDTMHFERVRPEFMSNPGRSDASAIWNSTSYKHKIDILTMGPGTRSHIDNGIARKTHGPDEGFHKDSGHIAIQYISALMTRFLE